MNYVLLILFFMIDIILLQPVKIVISIVSRCLWFPSITYSLMRSAKTYGFKLQKNSEFNHRIYNYDFLKLTADGDSFKWLGLYASSLIRYFSNQKKMGELGTSKIVPPDIENYIYRLHRLLLSYVGNDGYIGRYPNNHPDRYTTVNFSGDMVVGLMAWLTEVIRNDHPSVELTKSDLAKLVNLFEQTTFRRTDRHGNKGHLLHFGNAACELGRVKADDDRGYLYRWFGLGPDVIRLLTWFRLGYEITWEKKYLWFYRVLLVCYFPLLITSPGDLSIFLGRVYLVSWFTAHSNFFNAATLYRLTGSGIAEDACKDIAQKYPMNMAFASGWSAIMGPGHLNNRYFVETLISMSYDKGRTIYPEDLKKSYFSLRSFVFKQFASDVPTPDMLGHKYYTENNYLDPSVCDQTRRDIYCIDSLIDDLNMRH